MKNLSLVMLAMALAVGCGDDPVTPDSDSGMTPDAGGDTDGGGADEDGGGTDEDGGGTDEDGGGGGDDGGATPTLDCATYCATIRANCTGANEQYAPPGETDDCLATCEAFAEPGTLEDTSGNTLGCRIYHATAAASDADMHCGHAGPLGGGVCGTPCEGFCDLVDDLCDGAYTMGGAGRCSTLCAAYPEGDYSTASTSGNTLACRMYHLTVASNLPDPHCDHVGAISSTCGGVP